MAYKDNETRLAHDRKWRDANREKIDKYRHEWRAAHPNKDREYYLANAEQIKQRNREYHRKWYAANRERVRERCRQYNLNRRATTRSYARKWHAKTKTELVAVYGAKCVCCGETQPEFLTIDHVNGDGAEHRRKIGANLWWWLRKNNYPKEGFQLMCFNCNCAKGASGQCPHKTGLAK